MFNNRCGRQNFMAMPSQNGLIDIDKELNKGNYNNSNIYTKETILKLVNSISKNQYTNIEYIERF